MALKGTKVEDLIREVDGTPFRVLCKAKTLFLAYKKLKDDFEIPNENDLLTVCSRGSEIEAALCLFGFAFENLTKGTIAHNIGGSSLDSNRNLAKDIKSHDLVKLYEKAFNVQCSVSENQNLKQLEMYSLWAGRYTHPLFKRDWKLERPDEETLKMLEDMFEEKMLQTLKLIRPKYY